MTKMNDIVIKNIARSKIIMKNVQWDNFDWINALIGEIGESANIIKKINRTRNNIDFNNKSIDDYHNELSEELADCYIYLILLADHNNCVDLFYSNIPNEEESNNPAVLVCLLSRSLGYLLHDLIETELEDNEESGMIKILHDIEATENTRREITSMVSYLNQLYSYYNINVIESVKNKFNKTSKKINSEYFIK